MIRVTVYRVDDEGKQHYWGVYDFTPKDMGFFHSLLSTIWEFGLHHQNYHLEIETGGCRDDGEKE